MGFFIATLVVLFLGYLFTKIIIIVPQRHAVVKERLGKFAGVLGPGLHVLTPFVDRPAYKHETREQVIDIPPQSCITRDNIQVEVDGIVYFKVVDAKKASYGIGNYRQASINLAQTTMRSEVGKLSLDQTFSERDQINESIVREIDKASDPWGMKMTRYEIMNIKPSRRVIDTMEKQMEAERAKRAEITISTGQKEAQIQLSEAERQEYVNLSEGERQRRINEAHGQAEEIRLEADATAEGARLIAEAIRAPGGKAAVQNQLIEQYIKEFARIASQARVTVVPEDLANIQGVAEGLTRVTTALGSNTNRKG